MIGSRTGAGLALALASAVSFGLSGPFAKALLDAGWSANGAVLVRLGGAAAVLAVVLAVVRPGVFAAIRRDGPALLLYGVLAMAGVQVAFFNAVRYLQVPVALLLEYLGPVLTLVVQAWSGVGLRWEGVAWGLLAAACQASYFLVADRAGSQTPPLVLAGVGMAVGAVVVALLGLVGVLPIVIDTAATGAVLAGVDVGWPVAAGLLVGVSTVVAYLTGVAAIARLGAARGSIVMLLEVVASTVASWLLLGQVLAAMQLAGGVLILTGVAMTLALAAPAPAALGPVTTPAPPASAIKGKRSPASDTRRARSGAVSRPRHL